MFPVKCDFFIYRLLVSRKFIIAVPVILPAFGNSKMLKIKNFIPLCQDKIWRIGFSRITDMIRIDRLIFIINIMIR